MVRRVLPLGPVPARDGGVHADQQAAGGGPGPARGRRDGREHRPRGGLLHPAGGLLLLGHRPQVGGTGCRVQAHKHAHKWIRL